MGLGVFTSSADLEGPGELEVIGTSPCPTLAWHARMVFTQAQPRIGERC